jgi:hypothetical protein
VVIRLRHNTFCFFAIFLCCYVVSVAQNTTLLPKTKTANEKPIITKHKVMLIPFEPKMYTSEIDMYINQDTKLDGKQIKAAFRDGVNEQLYRALKSHYSVVDLLDDTVKTKKDISMIYQYLGYEYQKVPDQEHYSPPQKEKKEKTITNGQLTVETNTDQRFMNAKVKNAKLVPYLYDKYKCDIFVFVNQLDLKGSNSSGPAELANPNGIRRIVIHYTVYTYDAIELNSGIAEQEFPVTLNNPTRINGSYMSKAAQIITARIDKALNPVK